MIIKNSRDAIELKEILKIRQDLLDKMFSEDNYYKNVYLLTKETNDKYLDSRSSSHILLLENDIEYKNLLGRLIYNDIQDEYILKYFNDYCVQQRSKPKKPLNFIDLFSGAGGLSLGFVQEGFSVNMACDFEEACVETYLFNHPDVESKFILCEDIKNIEDTISNYLQNEKVDLVIGGPPCQGFSIANQQRVIDDPRNRLYKSFVRIVAEVQPLFFVMENVKGMLRVANQVKEDFEKLGYDVVFEVLKAQNFGVPQNRERLIFIGSKIPTAPSKIFKGISQFAKSLPKYVLEDAIRDLNVLSASELKNKTDIINKINGGIVIEKENKSDRNEYLETINPSGIVNNLIFNHQARYNNKRDIEIFGRLNQGDRSDDPKIKDIMPYKNRSHIFKDKYFKLVYNDICKTITAHMRFDCNMYIHPTQARGLTPREAARIQSYPDDYVFKGAYTKTYMQIGNSVPPLMGRYIAKAIKKYIEEEVSHEF